MATMSAYARRKMEEASPSRWHGIDAVMEQQLRRSYTRFIQRLGKTLRLPQHPTIAAATLLCHRFFLRQSHAKNDSLLIVSACLFLASKSEDTPCGLAYIAGAYNHLRFGARTTPKNPFLLEDKNLQKESERRILLTEHVVLCTLEFELEVELPYKPLFAILRMLRENLEMQKELIKLGERQLKLQREGKGHMLKPDQMSVGRGMDADTSVSKHTNDQWSSADTVNRHVGAGHVDARSKANGKLSQPVHMDNFGFNHAGEPHGSESAQMRAPARFEHLENDKYTQTRNGPDHMYHSKVGTYANDSVQTHYLRQGETAFHQVAWNFVNDTLLSLMCLQFKPHQIAAGAVWLAAKFLSVKLPSEGERSWWKEMNVVPLELEEVGSQFLEVYCAEEQANRRKGTIPQFVSKPHNLSM